MMSARLRRQFLLTLVFAGACSRPVLYYPVLDPAPAAPAAATPTSERAASVPLATSASTAVGAEYLTERHILLPVAGVDAARLEDSFLEGRDGGARVHRAIDIMAPRGTPILSADDGKILRMSTSSLGGICMYTVDPTSQLVYYYAHMDHYNERMSPGRTISKGDTLGFVGTSGNAPKDLPHLHFQVMRWPADGKYWNGDPIDPFEALGGTTRADRAKHVTGQPYEF